MLKPHNIVIFLVCCFVALALVCMFFPTDGVRLGDVTLRWLTLNKALDIDNDTCCYAFNEDSASLFADLTEDLIDTLPETVEESSALDASCVNTNNSVVAEAAPVVAPSYADVQEDTASYDPYACLSSFYASLANASSRTVRVVHYGDSQIEEDRMTTVLRRRLQEMFGGGGVGLLPLHQSIPRRTVEQKLYINGVLQNTQEGPMRYLVYGPKYMRRDNNRYGPMGQVAELLYNGEEVRVSVASNAKGGTERYFSKIRLWADDNISFSLTPDGPRDAHALSVPDSTVAVSLYFHGNGDVYGFSLETEKGVIVDNIPLRGSAGTVFTQIAPDQLRDFYKSTHTSLIILQFGGNSLPGITSPAIVRSSVNALRAQIRFFRSLVPDVAILFVGPSDMATLVDGELQTYPMLPLFDRALARMAKEERIAFWSLYNAMGGYGSMVRWVDNGLAGADYIHFTATGAEKAGNMLWKWLLAGFEQRQSDIVDE